MDMQNVFGSLFFITLLGIGLARIMFRINHRVELQQMQLKVSILIAKKLGVDKEDIDEALK